VNTVVDVGGGAGSLLAAILETHPATRGVLIDQPEVRPQAAVGTWRRGPLRLRRRQLL
jgi:hypothetical protein